MNLGKFTNQLKRSMLGERSQPPESECAEFFLALRQAERAGRDVTLAREIALAEAVRQQAFERETASIGRIWRVRLGLVVTVACGGRLALDLLTLDQVTQNDTSLWPIVAAIGCAWSSARLAPRMIPRTWILGQRGVLWLRALGDPQWNDLQSELGQELRHIKRTELRSGVDLATMRYKAIEDWANVWSQQDRERLERFLNWLPALELLALAAVSALVFAEPLFKLLPIV